MYSDPDPLPATKDSKEISQEILRRLWGVPRPLNPGQFSLGGLLKLTVTVSLLCSLITLSPETRAIAYNYAWQPFALNCEKILLLLMISLTFWAVWPVKNR